MKRKMMVAFLVIALVGTIFPVSAMAAYTPSQQCMIGYQRGLKPVSYVSSRVDYTLVLNVAILNSSGSQTQMGLVSNSGIVKASGNTVQEDWRAKNTFHVGVPTGSGTFGWAMTITDRFVIKHSGSQQVYPNY